MKSYSDSKRVENICRRCTIVGLCCVNGHKNWSFYVLIPTLLENRFLLAEHITGLSWARSIRFIHEGLQESQTSQKGLYISDVILFRATLDPSPLSSCRLLTYPLSPDDDIINVQDNPENVWDLKKCGKKIHYISYLAFDSCKI